jgi:hypothetical protein
MADEVDNRTFLPDGPYQCINCHSTLPPVRRSEPFPFPERPMPPSPFRTASLASPPAPGPTAPYQITQRRFLAMQQIGGSLRDVYIVEKPIQRFEEFCTDWERRFSALVINGNGFLPIVDEHRTVIGHLYDSTKMGCGIYCAGVQGEPGVRMSKCLENAYMGIEHLNEMLASEDAVAFIDNKMPPGPWAQFVQDLKPGYDLLAFCGVDGRVFQVIRGRGMPGIEAVSFNIDDLLVITALVKLGVKLGAKLIAAAGRKVGGVVTKLAIRGAGSELGQFFARKLAARQAAREASMLFKGLKMTRGYLAEMEVAEEHFAAMAQASRETNTIAIFRANKKAAIPLVRQGAYGKPMWAKFKTKVETGVLTAANDAERAIAFQNGAFVVEADTMGRRVACRTIMKNGAEVVEEVKLANMSKWNLEPGQVVMADGKPIVGDYDLLGAAPVESPGSNVSLVPENTAVGDWNGPAVKKYAEAANANMGKKMVLHGAQDAYGGNPKYMGLTDDTAYAIFPDGRTFLMRGRAEQQAFYDALGRAAKSTGAPVGVPGWTPTVLLGGKK